jgi:hypothetical protein
VRFEQGILGLAEVGEGAKQAEKAQDGHRRTVRFIGRWETGLDKAGIIEPGFGVPLFKACADFLVAPPPERSEAPPGWLLAVLPG